MTPRKIGIIGGSGIYDIEGLTGAAWREIATPFGSPSDAILEGELGGVPVAFLPRHGRGHRVPPSELNARANIDALKRAGVTELLSLSAVGSLREEHPPGTFVLVDQFVDRTFARAKSFFGTGLVAHVALAEPICARLSDAVAGAGAGAGIELVRGGTYLVMEGPQFSTRAESELYRSWGCAVIGMTNMPEAKLAREAELCYVTVAMVTDYDCWHEEHDSVTVTNVVQVLRENAARARQLVGACVAGLGAERSACPCGCDRALDHAIITAPSERDPALAAKLDAILARVDADPS